MLLQVLLKSYSLYEFSYQEAPAVFFDHIIQLQSVVTRNCLQGFLLVVKEGFGNIVIDGGQVDGFDSHRLSGAIMFA